MHRENWYLMFDLAFCPICWKCAFLYIHPNILYIIFVYYSIIFHVSTYNIYIYISYIYIICIYILYVLYIYIDILLDFLQYLQIFIMNFEEPPFSPNTAQNMKFSIKDFFSGCDQVCSFLQISAHLLKKSLMENFFVCVQCKTSNDCFFFRQEICIYATITALIRFENWFRICWNITDSSS